MHRIVVILFVVWITLPSTGQDVNIGIFDHLHFPKATFTAKGEFDVYGDGEFLFTLLNQQPADISNVAGKINIWFNSKSWKSFGMVEIVPRASNFQFHLQPLGAKKNVYLYEGKLKCFPQSGELQCVNVINIEHYVAGVIEAEAGGGELLEYYKVQAIISRTYALNNRRRHEAEGFEVCDGTHCQVYHGLPRREDLAIAAVAETQNLVIVDSEINLITAAFHSNCGGQTVNSDEVWSKPLPYLVSTPDSFCISMPASKWEKCISKQEWEDYIKSTSSQVKDDLIVDAGSRRFYKVDSCSFIPTLVMRRDLKLRSTLFEVKESGDKINIMGRGFGHGVGLCQEGAMQMAKRGFTYNEIIHYYYKSVHIIPLQRLSFFRDDGITDE